jgi:hypothetical protein
MKSKFQKHCLYISLLCLLLVLYICFFVGCATYETHSWERIPTTGKEVIRSWEEAELITAILLWRINPEKVANTTSGCLSVATRTYLSLKEQGKEAVLVTGRLHGSRHVCVAVYNNPTDPDVFDNGTLGEIWMKASWVRGFKPIIAFDEKNIWLFNSYFYGGK